MSASGILISLPNVTVPSAGTAVQINSGTVLCYKVIIQALRDNTGNVFLGDSNVASNRGIVLENDSDPIVLEAPDDGLLDLSSIYIDVATNDDGIAVIYLTRS